MTIHYVSLNINIEQVLFTILLTQLYQNFGSAIIYQVKQQCQALAAQAASSIRKVETYPEELKMANVSQLPAIVLINSVPYIALHELCSADAFPIVNYFASSLTLQGEIVEISSSISLS